MPKKTFGILLIAGGGLVYATAILMGVLGIPRPGWGYYKIPMAVIGVVVVGLGMLVLERGLKNTNDIPKRNNRYFLYGCVLNLSLSIFPRFPFLNHISSWWRSSHTLLTSFWFQKEGISLFHYQTPLYGPPWQVPLEFPLYQAMCTIFSNSTRLDLTLSSRLMSLSIFYLSALFLLLLCLEFIESKSLCFLILTVYLWLPFNIRYSTEILPDCLSVALALSYLYWIYKWLVSPRNYLFFILAILSGCLASVAKITTMPMVIIPAILMTLYGIQGWGINLRELFSPRKMIRQINSHKLSLFLLAGIAVLPLVSAVLWVKFEDGIKQANLYTAWLTSGNSDTWYVGTPGQNLSFSNWLGKFTNLSNYFFFGAVVLFPILGILCFYKLPEKSRCVFGSALTSALLTIFIFFNLYFHEYYYISVSACLCVLIGFGIYCLYKFILQRNIWWHVFAGLLMFFILLEGFEKYAFILNTVKEEIDHQTRVILPLAKKVAAVTPEDEFIISFQDDWFPDLMLFAQRKGLVISPREDKKYTCESITQYPYTTVVVVNRPVNSPEEDGLLKCFASVEMIEPGLYKVEP